MEKKTDSEKNAAQSIVNNFHSYRGSDTNAQRAKYYVKRLRQRTGLSEQYIMVQLLLAGFNEGSKFLEEKEQIRAEADKLFSEEREMI